MFFGKLIWIVLGFFCWVILNVLWIIFDVLLGWIIWVFYLVIGENMVIKFKYWWDLMCILLVLIWFVIVIKGVLFKLVLVILVIKLVVLGFNVDK